MSVSVIVGGQYGSEGKGKASLWLAQRRNAVAAIRVGGPNSGHSAIDEYGKLHVLRQIPTPALRQETISIIAPGSCIDLDVLTSEIALLKLTPDRLWIDPDAAIIDSNAKAAEGGLMVSIGSTGSGTGATLARRVSRDKKLHFAKEVEQIAPFVRNTTGLLRNILDRGDRVIIEGTQGFGLSLLHARNYPYVTSRDTTAAAFVSEAGLSPLDVDEVCMTLRCHPIRVGGDSGPLPNEISWEEVSRRLGTGARILEHTSVTKRLRRVGDFHPDVALRATEANKPTLILLNHLDYIPTSERRSFVKGVEASLRQRIHFVGLGPDVVENRDVVLADADVKLAAGKR